MSQHSQLADLVLPDILDVDDLAHHLRLSPEGVRVLLRSGDLPGKKIGRKWIVLREALLLALDPRTSRDAARLHLIPTSIPEVSP